MIKVANVETFNFEGAIRGMRNPLNSWDKSDTTLELILRHDAEHAMVVPHVGPNDLALMKRLYKAGPEHRKYLRQIFVSMDITAPLYWWKEMDQYKVGTVTDSCSTMHTIHSKMFELDDFSHEHLNPHSIDILQMIIGDLNIYRETYLETKDKDKWWQLIQLLPSSYNQKRTITMNYENVISIIHQRDGHKLDEWNDLVSRLLNLPYIKEIITQED